MSAQITAKERKEWDVDPDEWPHTPPFRIFAALMDEDDNTWWRAGSGHGLNAYDAAREQLEVLQEGVLKLADILEQCHKVCAGVRMDTPEDQALHDTHAEQVEILVRSLRAIAAAPDRPMVGEPL